MDFGAEAFRNIQDQIPIKRNVYLIPVKFRVLCYIVRPNTVHLTVRGEFVEQSAAHPESFDKLRADGISLTKQSIEACSPKFHARVASNRFPSN